MNNDEVKQAQEVIDSVMNGTGRLTPLKAVFPGEVSPEIQREANDAYTEYALQRHLEPVMSEDEWHALWIGFMLGRQG